MSDGKAIDGNGMTKDRPGVEASPAGQPAFTMKRCITAIGKRIVLCLTLGLTISCAVVVLAVLAMDRHQKRSLANCCVLLRSADAGARNEGRRQAFSISLFRWNRSAEVTHAMLERLEDFPAPEARAMFLARLSYWEGAKPSREDVPILIANLDLVDNIGPVDMLAALGPEASAALPKLEQLAQTHPNVAMRPRIIDAIAAIRGEASITYGSKPPEPKP